MKTEFIKIRKYIFRLIEENHGMEVKLPSLRVLAVQFNLTAPTVMRAVNDLIAEGYLIRCKGGGTITVPGGTRSCPHLVGILVASGMLFYEEEFYFRMKSIPVLALLRQGRSIGVAQIQLESYSQLKNVLEKNLYQALLLCSPSVQILKEVRKIKRKSDLPVLIFGGTEPFENSATFDLKKDFSAVLAKLTAEKRRKIIFLSLPVNSWNPKVKETAENFPNAEIVFREMSESMQMECLKRDAESGNRFDAVVFIQHFPLVQKYLRTEPAFKGIRFVVNTFALSCEKDFTGLVMEYDFNSPAEQLAAAMKRGFDGEHGAPLSLRFKMVLDEYENGTISRKGIEKK